MAEPRHDCLGHPLKVHVAGQDGKVGLGNVLGGGGGQAVSDEDVQQQLKTKTRSTRALTTEVGF